MFRFIGAQSIVRFTHTTKSQFHGCIQIMSKKKKKRMKGPSFLTRIQRKVVFMPSFKICKSFERVKIHILKNVLLRTTTIVAAPATELIRAIIDIHRSFALVGRGCVTMATPASFSQNSRSSKCIQNFSFVHNSITIDICFLKEGLNVAYSCTGQSL